MKSEALPSAPVALTTTPDAWVFYVHRSGVVIRLAALPLFGGDIHAAQKLARHSSISVTERYAHLSDEELDRTYHDVFNPEDA